MRIRYGTDGIAKHERSAGLTEAERADVSGVQARIHRKIATLRFACRCEHEVRLSDIELAQAEDVEKVVLEVLCPEQVRENHPNCAHNETWGRDPDPFGAEIRALIGLQILDLDDWDAWLRQMRARIADIDARVARAQGGPLAAAVPLDQPAEELQEPNLKELRYIGRLLKGITEAILAT